MSDNYINKIKIGNNEYDIQASSIGDVSGINITNNTVGTESAVNFTAKGSDSPTTKQGKISLNSKGNLAVESLTKHLNLESAKAIQLKPTTSIIIDTARRVSDGKDNEVEVVIKNDDSTSGEEPGYLKVNARAIDLRCHNHGGIALQPCGHDSSNHENKIKFESDRKVSANDTANPNSDYNGEGGKGVEFGTFNNEHTSLFSKDYRFNEDGKVYSVTRGAVETSSTGKSDYPTQGDDFKDILRTSKDNNCSYSNGEWAVSDPSKEYIMGATWKSIVKTANALNDRDWTDTNISNSGNLQITVADEIEWVEIPDYEGDSEPLTDATKQDPKRKYVGDGKVYKLLDNKYYTCQLKGNGEHHLNLEADGTIKIESGFDDIELTAGKDKIQMSAPEGSIQLETQKVDFSTTPEVSFMARKINKYGGYESSDTILKIASLNNFGKTVYENEDLGYIRIPYTTLYTSTGEVVPDIIRDTKVKVFEYDRTTQKPAGNYILQCGNLNLLVSVDSNGEMGKKSQVCNNSAKPTLYSNDTATTEFELNPDGYDDVEAPHVYIAASTAASDGYYIAKTASNIEYIIYVENGILHQQSVNNNGGTSGKELVPGWVIPLSGQGSRAAESDYIGIQFGGTDEANSNAGEVAIQNGSPLTVGMECNISDIITLVNYFKDRNIGPWGGPGGEDLDDLTGGVE